MSRRAPLAHVRELLVDARSTLATRSWCKGAPARDAQGLPVMPESPRAAAWSPTGALMLAVSRRAREVSVAFAGRELRAPLDEAWLASDAVEAVVALARAIDPRRRVDPRTGEEGPYLVTAATAYTTIANWNDSLDDGQAATVAKLTEAIAIACGDTGSARAPRRDGTDATASRGIAQRGQGG